MRTDYDTLVDDIAARAEIGNLATAERAAIEALLTLGEFIPANEADALGVVLPGALGDAVTEREESPEELSAEEFVELVAERQGFGVEPTDALAHVRAVVATVANYGGHDEIRQARDQLPEDFAPLFETAELAS